MKINKNLIIISLLLIFCISLGAVSAADNTDMSLNDINDDSIGNTMDIKTDDTNDNNINKLAEEYKTFEDLQQIISNTPEGGTIYLNGTNYVGSGEPITIDKSNIVICGGFEYDKTKTSTLNAQGKSRIFTCTPNANTLTFIGINFINGNSSDYGGAIYLASSSSNSWVNCSFTGNNATIGGAIYFNSGNDNTWSGCTFANNTATNGGGAIYLYLGNDNTWVNCSFTGNNANKGGAICFDSISSNYNSWVNCSFTGNTANKGGGGAIYLDFGSGNTWSSCNFANNFALLGGGGAIRFISGSGNTWTGCSFTGNSATNDGGAIRFTSDGTNNNAWMGCTFANNSANRGCGGVIQLSSGSSNSWVNCSFTGNSATNDGGGTIHFDGGVIHFYSGNDNTWSGCTFANNSATYGGGGAIYFNRSGYDNTWSGCTFANNSATYGGGAICFDLGNDNTWSGCTFANNSANRGGAIYFDLGISYNSWVNCSFTGNAATNDSGGAIYFNRSGDDNTWSGCTFANNSATYYGGAIYFNSGNDNTWSGCTFANNSATYGGGAIYFYVRSDDNTWSGCTFVNNSATYYGGAIMFVSFVSNNNNTWSGCTFVNNSATLDGGGGAIYLASGTRNNVIYCIFDNNKADYGGAIFLASGTDNNVIYCIFDNYKADYGGAIYCSGGSVDVDCNFFAFQNNIEFPTGLIEGASPNNWVVLNITESEGEYVVSFVLNDGSSLSDIMPDYEAVFSENGDIRSIVVKDNVWSGPVYKSGEITANVNSPVTGALLASLSITIKEVEIVLPVDPMFVVGAGEDYTVVIKSGGEAIGAGYIVVLELVNGDNRKNYTLITDDAGSVSLPIYLGYAKVYTFNIYFDAQGDYLVNTASQEIIVVPLVSSLITDYAEDKMDSTVYSGDYWTAKLVDNNGNAIANTYVDVHFKKVGADSDKVYKVKSDDNGNVKLQLNLGYTGDYIISAKFNGTSKYASSESHNITVTINKADVEIVTNYTYNTLFTTPNSGDKFKVQLLTVNDKVVKGVKLKINFTNKDGDGNVYTVTVKEDGFAYLPLNLSYVGTYFATVFFEGDSNYNPSQDSSTTLIIVEK